MITIDSEKTESKVKKFLFLAMVCIFLYLLNPTAYADSPVQQTVASKATRFLSNIYGLLTMIVMPIATVFFTVECIKVLIGNEKAVEAGVAKIKKIFFGIILLFAAPMIVQQIYVWFKYNGYNDNTLALEGSDPTGINKTFLPAIMGIYSFAVSIICAGTTVVVAASSISIIVGNQKEVDKAMMQIKIAITGMICLLLLPAVASAVIHFLGNSGYQLTPETKYDFGVPKVVVNPTTVTPKP